MPIQIVFEIIFQRCVVYMGNSRLLLLTFISLGIFLPSNSFGNDLRILNDFQGQLLCSKYNFTDIKNPYQGCDYYGVYKFSTYRNQDVKRIGPFIEVVPVGTSEHEFNFQRHIQFGVGLQWYPQRRKVDDYSPARAFRLFGQILGRHYYDEDSGSIIDDDYHLGLDYYYDNLFSPNKVVVFSFGNISYRSTNFSLANYESVVLLANVKVGMKYPWKSGKLVPYGLVDSTFSTKRERWFENFIRGGLGLRWYPQVYKYRKFVHGSEAIEFKRRFNFFAEVIRNISWLADSAPDIVEDYDIRLGFAFSTGGILGE